MHGASRTARPSSGSRPVARECRCAAPRREDSAPKTSVVVGDPRELAEKLGPARYLGKYAFPPGGSGRSGTSRTSPDRVERANDPADMWCSAGPRGAWPGRPGNIPGQRISTRCQAVRYGAEGGGTSRARRVVVAISPRVRITKARGADMTLTHDIPAALTDTMSPHCVRLILDTAKRLGVRDSDLARIGSLHRTELQDNAARIPALDMARLWEVLEQQVGREAGVRAAAAAEPGRLHAWDYLISTAPTLAEGLRVGARYLPIVCHPGAVLRVSEDDSRLTLELADSPYRGPAAAPRNSADVCPASRGVAPCEATVVGDCARDDPPCDVRAGRPRRRNG
ncbi:AraC family transcriptional regulator ligand-binding domain-containing protein [Nocardia sp. NPDC046763]|uniref:AraC family transcriptional regulator ligand-binding domain-containing protein n=1 Tax=Nocardia sp. NPDC046763 TaxID=3155256 RepID=UPI0033D50064